MRRHLAAALGVLAVLGSTAAARAQVSFLGLEQQCQLAGPPPSISFDTPTASIANSYNWIVEVANSQIGVYQRNGHLEWYNNLGGAPAPGYGCATNTDSFFGSNLSALGATRIVDTKVLFDDANHRFCVIGMQQDSGFAAGNQGLFVAWSNTDNPLPNGSVCGGGGWRIWRTPVPVLPGSTYQPDFNGMGQTSSHIVYSGVLQPVSNPLAQPYTIYRYIRKSDLNAHPAVLPYRDIIVPRVPSEFAHAADSFDPGSNIYLASVLVGANSLRLTCVNLGNDTEINLPLPVDPFVPASGAAPQFGGQYLDTIDGRMQSCVLRNGSLYCCHTVLVNVGASARHAVRWYQIALNAWPMVGGVPQVVQSGTIDLGVNTGLQGVHAFMPSLAVNEQDTVVVTYARSAANEKPSVAWSGRRAFDLLGTMPLGGNNQGGILKTSGVPYTTSNGTGGTPNAQRWGDWTSVVQNQAIYGGFVICGAHAEYGGTSCSPLQADHWETWIAPILPSQAQQTSYGTGFAGTGGVVPTIGVGQWPRIGWTPPVVLSNSAGVSTLGLVFAALADVPPPGLPTPYGATLWVDPATSASAAITLDPTSGQFPFAIPYDTAFVGLPLFFQGAVFDNGAAQGVATTRGLRVLVGI